jgi:hypothetical protein
MPDFSELSHSGVSLHLPVYRAAASMGKPSFESQELGSLFDEIKCEDDSRRMVGLEVAILMKRYAYLRADLSHFWALGTVW